MKCETETADQKDLIKTACLTSRVRLEAPRDESGSPALDRGSIKDRRPGAEDLLFVKAGRVSVKGLLPVTLEETRRHLIEPRAHYAGCQADGH